MTDVERKLVFPRDIITVGMNPELFDRDQLTAALRAGNLTVAKAILSKDGDAVAAAEATYGDHLANIRGELDRTRRKESL